MAGETYQWSKHVNFLRILDLPAARRPARSSWPSRTSPIRDGAVAAATTGWRLTERPRPSRDIGTTRSTSTPRAGELTVAKDLVARTRSGWFSDRSVCYLAAGKPVVAQDTGFSRFLPTGRGLFAFDTQAEAAAALDEIDRDYAEHSRAAHALAAEHFDSDRVLARSSAGRPDSDRARSRSHARPGSLAADGQAAPMTVREVGFAPGDPRTFVASRVTTLAAPALPPESRPARWWRTAPRATRHWPGSRW